MTTASLDLCKELYAISKWEIVSTNPIMGASQFHTPRYDLGYLLRKLPPVITIRFYGDKNRWQAVYYEKVRFKELERFADTPEDAACKLAIELIKQGIIQPQEGLK